MAFPSTWPPRVPSGNRSIRFYLVGTTTALFSDNAFIFADQAAANTFTPLPFVPPGAERQVVVVPPTPWGTGRDRGDANPDPASGPTLPPPPKMIWCRGLIVATTAAVALEFSFDGTNVHGFVGPSSSVMYFDRFEAGISVRGSGGTGTFRIEAW